MEQEKIDLIAEKVMGWKKDNYCVGVDVYKRPGISSLSVSEYNPFTNISQAIEALDKFCQSALDMWGYSILKNNLAMQNYYTCKIICKNLIVGEADTMAVAIVNALLEAIGGKG